MGNLLVWQRKDKFLSESDRTLARVDKIIIKFYEIIFLNGLLRIRQNYQVKVDLLLKKPADS